MDGWIERTLWHLRLYDNVTCTLLYSDFLNMLSWDDPGVMRTGNGTGKLLVCADSKYAAENEQINEMTDLSSN